MWVMIKETQVPDTLTHAPVEAFGGSVDTRSLIRPLTWAQRAEGRFVMPEEPFLADMLFTIHCTWTSGAVAHREQGPVLWRGCIAPLDTRSSEERNWL